MRKAISSLLIVAMLFSILMFSPNMINAAEVCNESVSASAIKTRDEAVAWLRAQEGARYDIDGAHGSQCSDFTSAYVNYVLTGNPYGGRIGVYNANQYSNANLYPSDWQVFANTPSFLPEPGDIFVVNGADARYGHTGVVISSTVYTATIADQNGLSDWSLDYGSPAHVHNITWTSSGTWAAKYYIRPCFASSGHNPEGVVDIIEGGEGKIHIRGWAFDRDDFGNQIPIHVYIGGRSGDSNAEGHAITANTQRTDVNAVYGCGDWHGFDAEITTSKRGNQPVYIYALNIGAGSDNPQIGEGTANIAEAVDPIDVSSVFYAKLAHADSGKCITQENPNGERYSNVALYQDDKKEDNTSYQLWKFERQSDLSYIITNVKTGHCLDDYNAASSNGNNVIAHEKNGSDAQRWYFVYGNGSSFSLVPKCAQSFALDLNGNYTSEGTNIQIYQRHQMAAQLFDIIQMDYLLGETEYNGNKYQLFNCPVSWKLAKELCENKGGHLVTITSKEEENAVNDLRSVNSNPYVWIGATDESGSWKWVTGEKFNYSNWDSGQPDNYQGIEHYACIWGTSKWNDYDNDACSYVNCYICEFEKIEPSSVKLDKSAINIEIGKTDTLTAIISPSNAFDKNITWTSSNSKVATVSNGTVTAVAAGTATITATTTNGKTATCSVTVKANDVSVTDVTLNKTSLSLVVGKSEMLTATVLPTNATEKAVTWTSNNAKVATVTNGKVTAVSEGTATITAKTSNGKQALCEVIVKKAVNPEAPQIVLEDKTVNGGSKIDVKVSIANNPGIVGMTLKIKFNNSVFKLVSVTDGEILGSNSHKPEYTSPYTLAWSNDTATTNITKNGVIATLTFEVDKSAEKGQYQIEVSYDYDNVDIYNKDLESVKFEISGGNIKIADYLCGDVNSDGKVNNLDRVYITRYLADWDEYQNINLEAADVNGDEKVNNLDKVILTRHLANWNDYASLPYKK